MHVSAKDLGTGNEQNVTITASTNLSDEDIDKAVKEAEKFAAEDKAKKEEIEIRNNGDSLVYQTEKTVKDLGNKISADDKAKIEAEVKALKDALAGTDTAAIKSASEKLTNVSYEVFGKAYQQQANANQNAGAAGGNAGQGGAQDAPKDDNVVDADYEVVDDDKDKK